MQEKMRYCIGADVHGSTTTLVLMDEGQQVLDCRKVATDEKALRVYLQGTPSPKAFVMEEGEFAQWLFSVLHTEVDDFVVCDPYRNSLLKEGAKNDRIDARKLAELYRAGLLKPVFHTLDPRMRLRTLVAVYRETIRCCVRTQHQLQGWQRRRSGASVHGRQDLSMALAGTLQAERLEFLSKQREDLVKAFEKVSRKFPEVGWLKSIPGIGPIGAIKVLATVVDPKRFPTKYHFWSYCGLVKHGRESAGKSYGHNRSQANREMKNVFKTAAVTSLLGRGPMRKYYEQLLEKGLAAHDARHAVARRIAAVTLACWKHGKKFDPDYERKRTDLN